MKATTATKTVRRSDVTLRKDFIRCWVHANPVTSREDANLLYDLLEREFKGMTRGGHRGMVGRIKPWETVEHECPNCGTEAVGFDAIVTKFGLRSVKVKAGRKKYFQSYCPPCRAERRQNKHVGNGDIRINPEVEKFYTN